MVALKLGNAEHYRLLGTLYGQAITDLLTGLSYGPKAKDAINKAVEKAPKSSMMYVARGVGNYYVPASLGGGASLSITDFRKAIELDATNAEAWLWLGLGLRKENRDAEARQAFAKSLELNPNRVWAKQQLAKTPVK
jgi:tetratricopeptide (TPR) repeat protein